MRSPADAHGRRATWPLPAEEARPLGADERARRRDMASLEQLRKLRRERAESAMHAAHARVVSAQGLVQERRHLVSERHRQYVSMQDVVTNRLEVGRSSLEEVRQLLDDVDRVRGAFFEAQTMVAVQLGEVSKAQADLQKVREATRVAATAHEKVLEWKRSV